MPKGDPIRARQVKFVLTLAGHIARNHQSGSVQMFLFALRAADSQEGYAVQFVCDDH
jgi:hypothetical protein